MPKSRPDRAQLGAHQDALHIDQAHSDTPPAWVSHTDQGSNWHTDHADGIGKFPPHHDQSMTHHDQGLHTEPHGDRAHHDSCHSDVYNSSQSLPPNLAAAKGTFVLAVDNRQAQGQNSQVIYLVGESDQSRNDLYVAIRNISGSTITLQNSDKLTLFMRQVLPSSVIERIHITGQGWQFSQHSGRGGIKGYDMRPASSLSWSNGQIITFHLTNIYFTASDLNGVPSSHQGDFVLEYDTPHRGDTPAKIFLLQWHQQPSRLRHFEAAFSRVPSSEQWNVKLGETGVWLPGKDEEIVFSNAISNIDIRTRLAFRLTNQDFVQDLTLTPDSNIKISFLEGDHGGQLATTQNLVNNLSISELNTNDWEFTEATSTDPVWTMTPKRSITLASGGGSYQFLIDSVLANGFPSTNVHGADFTEMYIRYSNIPNPGGSGNYDDDYLPVTIEKVAPGRPLIVALLDNKTLTYQGSDVRSLSPRTDQYLIVHRASLSLQSNGDVTVHLEVSYQNCQPRAVQLHGTYSFQQGSSSSMRLNIICSGPANVGLPIDSGTDNYSLTNLALAIKACIDDQNGTLSVMTITDASAAYAGDGRTGQLRVAVSGELWSFD